MSKRKGFTLIELLVVIAIIGILSAVVIASMSGARSKGRDAKRIADTKQLQLALQLFYDAKSTYPTLGGNIDVSAATNLFPDYITVRPTEPTQGRHYWYVPLPSGCDNATNGACTDYVIAAQLENVLSGLGNYTGPLPTFSFNTLSN